jgi:hypothetical protein
MQGICKIQELFYLENKFDSWEIQSFDVAHEGRDEKEKKRN